VSDSILLLPVTVTRWLKQSQEQYGVTPQENDIEALETLPEEIAEIRKVDGDLFVENSTLRDSLKGVHPTSRYPADSSSPSLFFPFLCAAEMRRRGASRNDVLKDSGILKLVFLSPTHNSLSIFSSHGFNKSFSCLLGEGLCAASTRGSYFRDKIEKSVPSPFGSLSHLFPGGGVVG
jgi:hypothetical protein